MQRCRHPVIEVPQRVQFAEIAQRPQARQDYRLADLAATVDVIDLMTYDQHGPGWSGPGPIGALPWQLEVDITAVRGRKLAAISAHRSQLPGGDPYALFPPGVLAGCLDVERFTIATGSKRPPAFPFSQAARPLTNTPWRGGNTQP